MSKKTWVKPARKWGDALTPTSISVHPIRLRAIDEYRKGQSTTEVAVSRSMVFNELVRDHPEIAEIEQRIEEEAAVNKIRNKRNKRLPRF